MDGAWFDDLARSLIASRRTMLGATVALAWSMIGMSAADARKKRKRKKQGKPKMPPEPNEYGCLDVGDPCASEAECCSGICENNTCQAHGAGTCKPQPGFCLDSTSTLLPCNNEIGCVCLRTTANSLFCADLGASACAECQRDVDCTRSGFPVGSACVPVGEGACAGACESGMLCTAPCGDG